MKIFSLHADHVTLGQLLKLTGIIASGGEAKFYLAGSPVLVNGLPEQRRGRKLRTGDLVEAPNEAPITISGELLEHDALDSEDA